MDPISQPLVSVVTPVYNGERYLEECIESVLVQTYENWEYVIVNNYSTDRSLEISRSYAQKDRRIRIHNNSDFLSLMKNHNHALRQISAESKYCKVVHADDWLFPECIMQMVKVAEANPSVGVVASYMIQGSRVVCDKLPCPPVSDRLQFPITTMSGREICHFDILNEGPSILGSPTTLLIRADLIRNRKAFYDEAHLYADRIATYEALQHSDFGFVHHVLSYMREHDEQVMSFMRRVNAWMSCRLYILTNYGPVFLKTDEYEKLLRQKLKDYYKFLGKTVYHRRSCWKEKDFWDWHRDELKKIGYPLSLTKLLGAFSLELLDYLLNPKNAIEKISRKLIRILRRTRE